MTSRTPLRVGPGLPVEPTGPQGVETFSPTPIPKEGRGAGGRVQSPVARGLTNHAHVMKPPYDPEDRTQSFQAGTHVEAGRVAPGKRMGARDASSTYPVRLFLLAVLELCRFI